MLAVAIVVLALSAATLQVNYNGYKVFRVIPESNADAKLLEDIRHNSDFDFWSSLSYKGHPADVMVAPSAQINFEQNLITHKTKYQVLIENVEDVIQKERLQLREAPKVQQGRITFDQYYQYDDIVVYLQQLATQFPNIVTLENIGVSFEGRTLYAIKISSNGGATNPIIFLEGGNHAREWIGPAQALYIAQELVQNPSNNLTVNVDWLIIPVMNPDGYEYTFTTDRLWRKTRSPPVSTTCWGADGNRNFDFHWGGLGSTTTDECSEVFSGQSPFSEPEAQAFRDYALRYASRIKVYVSLHSYGQYILYPWSYTTDLPPNAAQLQSIGDAMNSAIQSVAGTTYIVGPSTATLYYACGCSDDWVMGVAGVPIVFVFELPGGGSAGFDLPPSSIDPVVKETFEGIRLLPGYI